MASHEMSFLKALCTNSTQMLIYRDLKAILTCLPVLCFLSYTHLLGNLQISLLLRETNST